MSDENRDKLLSFLRQLKHKDDRAALASLRCALVKSRQYRAWPLLAWFGGIEDAFKEYDHEAKVVQTVAGLFATHPEDTDRGDFGTVCRELMNEDELRNLVSDPTAVGSVARRFQHLLAADDGKEINDRVIRLVLRLKANGIAVNYDDLYQGLMDWKNEDWRRDKARNRWAGSFWQVKGLEEAVL